jgi:hypothetical protein
LDVSFFAGVLEGAEAGDFAGEAGAFLKVFVDFFVFVPVEAPDFQADVFNEFFPF